MITLKAKTPEIIDLPGLKSISVGRAYDLLRADMQEHLRTARKEFGFTYCRFHALFNEDMDVAYRREDGTIGYHWHHIDKIYDFLLSIGMKPFIELMAMPRVMASGEQTMFFYKMNVTPPANMKDWYELVYHFTKHVVDRYGLKEVSTWFFEVWNEPNIKGFWSGTKEEYFELYQNAAHAVKAVNSGLKVGGPATAVADWLTEFIDFCDSTHTPLDFITTHVYQMDEYCRYKDHEESPYGLGEYYAAVVKGAKKEIENSVMPDLPIYWTEYNALACDCQKTVKFTHNPSVDRLYAASCIIRNMIDVRKKCETVSYWVLSDIFEESRMTHIPFSGTYGLMNIHGIHKAGYNAFKLLRKLRGNVIETEADTECPLGCGSIVTEEHGTYRILMWNNVLPEIKNQPEWKETIRLNLDSKNYIAESAMITKEHGSPYEVWMNMGSPENLTPFEEEYLRACGEMKYSLNPFIDDMGTIEVCLQPDEVAYFEVRPKDSKAVLGDNQLEEKLHTY